MEAFASIKIPNGYKFHPTDEELIHYLLCKANEVPLPCQGVVNDVIDLYGKEPSELFEGSKEKIIYFFTKLKKKREKGSRMNRLTRVGTWKGQHKAKDILKDGCTGNEEEGEKTVIGMKRNFTYYVKSDPKKSGWSMTEHYLGGINLERAKVKDYVISRIKRQKQEEKEGAMEVATTVMQPAEASNAIIEATKPKVSVMQYNVIEAAIEPEVTLIQPEDCNLIKEEIEPEVTVKQQEDCNLIIEGIEPESMVLQPEDRNDWAVLQQDPFLSLIFDPQLFFC